jgi:hypothetical protein
MARYDCSYRELVRMPPFPLERPFGTSTRASRSDKLDEYDAANIAAAAAKAEHISEAEIGRRAALKTQARQKGRFVKVDEDKNPKKEKATVAAKPAKPRSRPSKHAAASPEQFEVTAS